MTKLSNEKELEILRILELDPETTQRQLAGQLGISLGKTNFLLKALLNKGWVKAKNFTHSNHKVGYLYFLTPEGISGKVLLTQQYLKLKEREYESLREQIKLLRSEMTKSDSV